MQGWRKRMEDAHIHKLGIGESKTVDIYGVFDGHGGKEVSQFVKAHFVAELEKNENFKKNDYKKALKETFLKMDDLMRTPQGKNEIVQNSNKSKEEDEAQKAKIGPQNPQEEMFLNLMKPKLDPNDPAKFIGCTSCVCLVDNAKKQLYFANSGDSRVVLCKKGLAYPMSIDHKPELDIEKNRIINAGGFINEGRIKGNLNLSRGLGDLEYKNNKHLSPEDQMITANPDIIQEELTKDCDFIIIGCDGIWDCLSNQEACDYVNNKLTKNPNEKLSKIVEDMMDSIIATDIYNENGIGCDNMTCMIIQFIHQH